MRQERPYPVRRSLLHRGPRSLLVPRVQRNQPAPWLPLLSPVLFNQAPPLNAHLPASRRRALSFRLGLILPLS
jgi:hypothetical protein